MLVNYLFYIIGQVTGQWTFVIKKMYLRGKAYIQLVFLCLKRAAKLYNPVELLLFSTWLFSNLGYKHYSTKYFRYYRGIAEYVLRFVGLGFVFTYLYSKFDLEAYSSYIFNLFEQPIMSAKGYLPYAIVVSCTLVWLIFLSIALLSRSVRFLLQPYSRKVLVLNLVVFILLMSLFTKIGRAKFGVRVWYPTDRVYGGRLGFEFWD